MFLARACLLSTALIKLWACLWESYWELLVGTELCYGSGNQAHVTFYLKRFWVCMCVVITSVSVIEELKL